MRIYNSITKTVENFHSIEPNRVRMYSCGPTVYSDHHIGNLRSILLADILKRALQVKGFRIQHVMNITDVGHLTSDADSGEDKVESAAKERGIDVWTLTEQYKTKYMLDCAALNIIPPDVVCRATDHIQEQIALAQRIEARGYTYLTDDGLYFDAQSFEPITDLSNMSRLASEEHSRVGAQGKRSGADFALWKFSRASEKRLMEWPSPWGVGFPGWHLECSAMAMKYLGDSFDIHTGCVDNIPIHHVNEIRQSESVTGVKFVNYWVHGGWLRMGESDKMSKSKGTTVLLDDIVERGYDPLAFRYLTLTAHYRGPLQFTWEALDAAMTALSRIRRDVASLDDEGEASKRYMRLFAEALGNDLNTADVLSILWQLLKDPEVDEGSKRATARQMDRVLGLALYRNPSGGHLEVPAEVIHLVNKRDSLREKRRFAEADEMRNRIVLLGFELMDTPDGTVLRSR